MSDNRMRAIGLMSGTSLDGVDAAVLDTDGDRIFSFGQAVTVPFNGRTDFADVISAALKWQFTGPQPEIFAKASDSIHANHIAAIEALDADMTGIDLIGFHGQTVLHRPAIGADKGQTLQIGDGSVLAEKFGVPCVYDFRSADVAAGGQGAPLAPIYHKALCDFSGLSGPVAVVNIGGVSNMTLINGGAPLIATDCGPGNGPLDSWMQAKGHKKYDSGGAMSMAGTPDFALIERWLSRDFFTRPIPRSADRYDFDVSGDMSNLSAADGAATLAGFCAGAIARDLAAYRPKSVIICGGGRQNAAITGMLDMQIEGDVKTAENVGWDGDALEAQAFAYLAVRSLRGLPISFPGTTGVASPMTGGVITQP